MYKKIESTHNALIKELIQLKEKSRNRKKTNTFMIEGVREITLAIQGNFIFQTLLVDFSLANKQVFEQLVSTISVEIEIIEISNTVYQKLAHRDTTEGVLAIAHSKKLELEAISFKTKKPLILVAEAPEKPGNIGALLRTADAAGVDAVLIANPKTDMYNPNIIRSSVGCIFTNQIATGSTDEIISFLKKHSIEIYGAALTASNIYSAIDFKKASAIVVGTEDLGLSTTWLENTTTNIIIPMHGKIDSMNVSVSAAIILFEAVRQRFI